MSAEPVTAASVAEAWTPDALARGAVATIDLDALRHNVARCLAVADGAGRMAGVKADA